ncbi:MAG: molybdopterin dehydrogenase [Dehalococcoidia bacterium]|nr:MAG: molybdopterin dehydrogenase [Dehalococcoidia bacterium]
MKYIKHVDVTTVDAAIAELKKGKAAVIAGGTDIIGEFKSMTSPNLPDTLVNIKGIAALSKLTEEGGVLKIGALTTLSEIADSSVVQTKYTALAQAARKVASPELRNMGTIGGNICQHVRCWYYRHEHNAFACLRKNPQGLCYALAGDNRYHSIFGAVSGCVAVNPSDIAPALVALDAKIVTSKKTVAAQDFFATKLAPAGEGTTVLDADEIVIEIQVPAPAAGVKSAFVKFALRKSFDFPIVNCAAMIGGTNARICLNAVHNTPRRVTAAEDAVKGKTIDNTVAEAAGAAAVTGAMALPVTGWSYGNKYMIQIAKTVVKRAVLACK